jgi:uncharacterized protein (DUF2141 family)
MTLVFLLAAAAGIVSGPSLGVAAGRCRPNEPGPAFLVDAVGFRSREGNVKLEAYPSNDADFLGDDATLVAAGKIFRRVEEAVPRQGAVLICIRVPRPGPYSLVLLDDVNANHRFNVSSDGIGFPNNPTLGWSKPSAAATRAVAGSGLTRIRIVLNYRQGFSFRPLD